ncbi:ribosomal-protein-alanine N-acetyltransferase [Pullulanibacillus pueri]|uniref:N-acetyltransferase n=1 Tax=Pullulanibacillus pueri TaxID=1437324 RepID=A0A8J2ZYT1_9BACL|nr:ribosomal-protein-alanine N-acetyltransferase [Pullulanibacillus pueri]GGH87296.1 N-acetyltransferase [Pullulanibacillus pueri]
MTQKEAENIAFHWHYEEIYSFYDMTADEEDLRGFLDSDQRGDAVVSVIENASLVGFFSFEETKEKATEIGPGMRPDITKEGKGLAFVRAEIDFVKEHFASEMITLSFAIFNKRAIKCIKKLDLSLWDQQSGNEW